MGQFGDIAGAALGAIGAGLGFATDQQNYKAQKEQLKWQKYAQRTTWEREDNAVQRRVDDLRAAGLSPVLAAGSAAQTSGPIQVTAPQRNLSAFDKAQGAMALMLQQRNITRTVAEEERIKADASLAKSKEVTERHQRDLMDTQRYLAENQQAEVQAKTIEAASRTALNAAETATKNYDLEWSRRYGVKTTQNSGKVQEVLQGLGVTGKLFDWLKKGLTKEGGPVPNAQIPLIEKLNGGAK